MIGSGSGEEDYLNKIGASEQVRNIRCSSISYQIAPYAGIRVL
jgi:hypothetical protein